MRVRIIRTNLEILNRFELEGPLVFERHSHTGPIFFGDTEYQSVVIRSRVLQRAFSRSLDEQARGPVNPDNGEKRYLVFLRPEWL